MRQYWKASEKLTHCKRCGKELLPHKIYFCTSECQWKWGQEQKKKAC